MDMMKSLTFKTRLSFLVALVLVLIATIGLVSLVKLQGAAHSIDSVYRDRLLPMQQLRLVSQGFTVGLQISAQRYADGQLSAPLMLQQLDEIERTVRRNWAEYLHSEVVDAEKALILRAEPLIAQGLRQLAQLRDLAQAGSDEANLRRVPLQSLREGIDAIAQVTDALIDLQLDVAQRASIQGQAAFDQAVWLVLALVLGTGGLGLALGWSVWLRHRHEQGDAETSRARVQQFYLALSQTSQLIVRSPESAGLLYEGLCRICVETGQAQLASVVLFDGQQFERVATHGPADQLMPGVPSRWGSDAPFAQSSMSSEAIRRGEHVLSNRVLKDQRLAQWPGAVIPPGVEAMAAFPLRRGGRVVGALSLLAGARDFFDAALVELLDEMIDDVSFALDNLDREQARQQALAQAESGLALFKQLFNTSSVSVIVTAQADGTVVEINDTLCQRYGYSREALVGHRLSEFQVGFSEETRERFYAQMNRLGCVRNMEAQVRTRGGGLRHSLVNGDVIDYRGQACVLSTSVDITELRQAQEAAQARASAEAANRAKTEFLAQMSHELRTPLNALLGFTQLLEVDARTLPDNQREWLSHMRRAGWHLLDLINDVLDISRIEAGEMQLQPEPLALAPLLAEVLALSAGEARERGLSLQGPAVLAPGLSVRADRRRLQQVLLNLLSNASKYNRPGGRVELQVEAAGDHVRLHVSDTGLGMDEAQLARLFEPFNRLGRENGGIEGTGIGLALSRQLMRLMGGAIEVRSQPGEGTRASLVLPMTPPVVVAAVLLPIASESPPVEGVVLYIEDNAVNRLIVEQMLARWPGLRCECAEDGESGLRRALALQPDLVLLDMQLPDISGFDVLARLKAEPQTAQLPVVALSASAMADEVEAALAAGALDYWSKPLELGPFLEKMRGLLQQRTLTGLQT